MEESLGAQYAIQIAVHTLRDRCKSLQHRIAVLEEENMNLRIGYSRKEDKEHSLSELDKLKEHITQLSEQKQQLQNKIKMVSNENQDLWSKLGKLTVVNKNLGDRLNKINDTVSQHAQPLQPHTALIRSKTFTQVEPQTRFLQMNLELNQTISLELEDVSLKLTDSFSKQKMELDKICSDIDEIQYSDIITENCSFCYDEKLEEDMVEDIKYLLDTLELLQEEVLKQRNIIQRNIKNLNKMKEENVCKICEKRKDGILDRSTSTTDIPKLGIDKCTEALNFDDDDMSSSDKISEAEKNMSDM
ncbi:hypothetical protein NQ317_017858 [Molorchus minor]|uniref:Uncharacterized protein n=1 Tax=Molorchus minor TaxID=1323400 RepID=A0ABQ9JZI2_9CUCU|nr:hypothetical protein NQ317_017858 [Molorchus minor]